MRRLGSLLLIYSLVLFIAGCSQQEERTDKIHVVVSIMPLAEFVEKIGGDRVTVSVMVPPGASPHTHEPTPGQLVKVSRADMYVKVGSPVEFELVWLDRIISMNKNMLVNDASFNIELVKVGCRYVDSEGLHKHEAHTQEQHNRGYDPHIWLSPKNAKIMVRNIYNGFISIDPNNKNYYIANKEEYLNLLSSLDHDIEQILQEKSIREFMVYHPAWSYFAKDYNLAQIPVETEGKEPTAHGMERLIKHAKERNIKIIFASPQFNMKSAEVIAREINGLVVLIDPLEKEYIANMRKISKALAEVME